MRLIRVLWLVVTGVCLALPLAAQEAESVIEGPAGTVGAEIAADEEEAAPAEAPAVAVPVNAPSEWWRPSTDGDGPDYNSWLRTAARAAMLSEAGRGSTFALQRLRREIVEWRDRFLAEQSRNSGRIRTVTAQIDALGPAPAEGAVEPDEIAARRAELQAELARLRAPVILAQEAHAHANGLINEIDTLIRAGQTRRVLERGPSPLNPVLWTGALDEFRLRVVELVGEWTQTLASPSRRTALLSFLPAITVLLGGSIAVLMFGGRMMRWIRGRVMARGMRGKGVWDFLLSIAQLGIGAFALLAISATIAAAEFGGVRTERLLVLPLQAGMSVLVAIWLADHFFSPGAVNHPPLDFEPERRRRARGLVLKLGWFLAADAVILGVLSIGETSAAARAVLTLPLDLMLGLVLFQLGRLFVRSGAPAAAGEAGQDSVNFRRGLFVLVGRLVMIAAVAGPVLAIFGYSAASDALTRPTILTLALIGLVILLQGLVHDIYSLVMGTADGDRDALVPVLIAFSLILLATPVLALIWGARMEDLTEIWARFREGYSLGETRISPSDFLTFLVIFGLGYVLTRLLQGALRNSILPRTKIDVGGRHAIVAGVGYLGLFVAAVAAVTGAGINLSSLAIVAGALSVGIGFGLQNIVQNFVSGIILLIERPISEGDWIEVGGQMGYVRDISVRSTRIETFDRTDVIIPNADLVSGRVTNWTRGNSVGRIIVKVGVAYGTDTKRVEAILREVAEAHPMVLLTPPPAVPFIGFGADSLDFEIRAILRDVSFGLSVKSDMHHEIARRFAEEGIEIPFAQRDLWLRNPEALAEAQERSRPAPAARFRDDPPDESPEAGDPSEMPG